MSRFESRFLEVAWVVSWVEITFNNQLESWVESKTHGVIFILLGKIFPTSWNPFLSKRAWVTVSATFVLVGEGGGAKWPHLQNKKKLRVKKWRRKKRSNALNEYIRKYSGIFRSGQCWGHQRSSKGKFGRMSYYFFEYLPVSQNLL